MVNTPESRENKKLRLLNVAGEMKEGDMILPTPLSEKVEIHLNTLLAYTHFAEAYRESGLRAMFDAEGEISAYIMKGEENINVEKELKEIIKLLKELKTIKLLKEFKNAKK